jgi:hypothetical protein
MDILITSIFFGVGLGLITVSTIFYYLFLLELPPTFVVDISDYVDQWVAALLIWSNTPSRWP